MVKGAPVTAASVKSAGYLSEKWVQLTLRARGKDISVRLKRLDTGQYLDAAGQWQAKPSWVIGLADDEVAGEGQVGLARLASYAGTVSFDDFTAGKPSDDEPAVAAAKPKPNDDPAPQPKKSPAVVKTPSQPPGSITLPEIPRHYGHIRIAMLAYYGNPMG